MSSSFVRIIEALIYGFLVIVVGVVAWANGGLVAERDIWRREALASQAERANAETKLMQCEVRRGR